ncbi:TonB-dependent receptor plug domain-containing protein [Silvibacterium dinghuense]|nr:TonB-dependent receptor [Silvibacterium dinghuense]
MSVRHRIASFAILVAQSGFAFSQQNQSSSTASASPTLPAQQQTVVVVGSPEAITLGESPRSVMAVEVGQQPFSFETAEDALRTDPSTFIEQRGAGGAQSDITIRGASFEQTLVLLNGLRIDDAQSSHHNLDLPVPLEAMRSVEVLHGAGSTLYGSDALGGVVNFITATPTEDSLTLRAGAGSFGGNEESAIATAAGHRWSEIATGARNFSTGFMPDRDYRNENASNESRWSSALGTTDILLAGSDRAFGADNFYGLYNSWERTKGWFASAQQQLGENTSAAFGYRRHTDNFILLRNDPAYYANNHIDTSWQAVVRRQQPLGHEGGLFYGLDAEGDSIDSNNLGHHARNQGAGYADLDLHSTRRWSLSAGLREEVLSGGARSVTSPDLAGSFWVAPKVKIRASGGYGFRLPTYTDLYYSDPTTNGDPNLKPESAWSGDTGVDWFPNTRTTASMTLFYSRQHDAIDYVRANDTEKWQATNLNGLRYAGVESSLGWRPTATQSIQLGWTILAGAQSALHGLQSQYVFNYPVNNASFEWSDTFAHAYFVRTIVRVAQRYQQEAYPVWDLEMARSKGWIHPYFRAVNLSNTGYQEIVDVPMPGRSFAGGVEISLRRKP